MSMGDILEKRIVHMIDEMTFEERIIFVGYYYNQITISEIAEITGLSVEIVIKFLLSCSNKIIKDVGRGGLYFAALMSFFAMGSEASECCPSK